MVRRLLNIDQALINFLFARNASLTAVVSCSAVAQVHALVGGITQVDISATTHAASFDVKLIVSFKMTAVIEMVADEGVDTLAISAIDATVIEIAVAVAKSVSQINLPAIIIIATAIALPYVYSHTGPKIAY